MQNNSIKNKLFSGLLWRFAERIGSQGIQFIVSLVLARLLSPSDYGLIGLITVFIVISNTFVQSGFGQALIQKKEIDDVDWSSVFYFNVLMSILLYFVLFSFAPVIAKFYNEPLLINVIRVLAISLIIGGVNGVQQAYVQKTMQFKRFFYATLIGTLISAVIGILAALKGWGVWALVAQQLSSQFINTVTLWFTVKWRPKKLFSFSRMKTLFSFGNKLLCSSLLETIYSNLYSLIIGKLFSTTSLGYYSRGKQFPSLIITNINDSIGSVIYPLLANMQDNVQSIKQLIRRAIMTSSYLIFPAMCGLAVIAPQFIKIILTDKWLPAVPFIQFNCFIYAFWPIHTSNLQAIKAMGRSDLYLSLEVKKKIVGLTILAICIPFGLYAMMLGQCFTTVLSSFINASPNKKLLRYSFIEQIKDVMPAMFLSGFMGLIIYPISYLNISAYLIMILQIIIGVIVYYIGSRILKLESYEYLLNTLKSKKK